MADMLISLYELVESFIPQSARFILLTILAIICLINAISAVCSFLFNQMEKRRRWDREFIELLNVEAGLFRRFERKIDNMENNESTQTAFNELAEGFEKVRDFYKEHWNHLSLYAEKYYNFQVDYDFLYREWRRLAGYHIINPKAMTDIRQPLAKASSSLQSLLVT